MQRNSFFNQWVLVSLTSFTLFVIVATLVANYTDIIQFINQPVAVVFEVKTAFLSYSAVLLSLLGQKRIIIPTSFIMWLYLAWRREWLLAFIWAGLILSLIISVEIVKHLVASPRPGNLTHSFSFPSGHTTIAATFYIFLTYLATQNNKRYFTYFGTFALICAIAWSRLALHQHWLTDVIGGALLGLSLSTLAIGYCVYYKIKFAFFNQWIRIGIISFVVFTIYFMMFHLNGNLKIWA